MKKRGGVRVGAQTHAHTHESDLIPPRVTRATFHDICTAHRGESRTFPVSRRDARDSRSSPLGGKNRVVLALARIFFLFSNRRGAPPRRPVAARKLPPRASSVRRIGPDVSSLPSRGIRDRAPGVDETRTHLGSGSGRKGSKLVGARLLNNTRLPRLDRDRALTRPIEHVD